MDTLKPNQLLSGELLYNQALNLIIQKAQSELLIFDQDLKVGDYQSLSRYEALKNFLAANPATTLVMILHEDQFFQSHCPRLNTLFATYSHKMNIRITNAHAKIAKDCFIIADHQHYVRRIHIDQARFRFNLNDRHTTMELKQRFQALLDETTHALSPSVTGL